MVVTANESPLFTLPCMVYPECDGSDAQKGECRSGILLFSPKNLRHCYILSVYAPLSEQEKDYVTFDEDNIYTEILLNFNSRGIILRARPVVAWRSLELVSHLQKVFQPRRQWTLSYEDDKCDKETEAKAGYDAESLSWFILYEADQSFFECEAWGDLVQGAAPLRSDIGLRVGSAVATRSYPFGPDVMEIFTETQSSGIVSNMSTSVRAPLFLTDARCLPGSEGGCVYTYDSRDSCEVPVGMIVSPLCWKSKELLGLALCCSLHEIVLSLLCIPRDMAHVHSELRKLLKRFLSGDTKGRIPKFIGPTVLRVTAGGIWGSGVVVAARTVVESCDIIIATCKHVVEKAINNSVNIAFDGTRKRYRGRVLFCTDDKSAYDLAILKLNIGNSTFATLLPYESISMAELGKDLYIVPYSHHAHGFGKGARTLVKGYALFDEESDLGPSLSRGVLSSITHHAGQPVLLHSTCLVHKGSSGGGLICARTGNLEGIVVNHVKDVETKITYPDVNFSVPCDIFMPAVEKYLASNDVSAFSCLNCHNKEVIRMWNMEPKQNVAASQDLMSKL